MRSKQEVVEIEYGTEKWQRSVPGTYEPYEHCKKLHLHGCPCKLNRYQSDYNDKYKQRRTYSTHGEILKHTHDSDWEMWKKSREETRLIPVTEFDDNEIGCSSMD
jgi:hypothetical protein